mgnify:CR=1 FL=1
MHSAPYPLTSSTSELINFFHKHQEVKTDQILDMLGGPEFIKGKEILVNEGVWQPWFMAPNHSFDVATLEALNKLDFVAITDGYGFYPYLSHSLLFVPQMTSFPIKIGFGLSTICLHINSMTPSDILTITQFILGNKDKFVDFKDVVEDGSVNGMHATSQRMISRTLLRSYRSIKAL